MREIEFPLETIQKEIKWTPFWKRPTVIMWFRDGLIGAGIFGVIYWLFF